MPLLAQRSTLAFLGIRRGAAAASAQQTLVAVPSLPIQAVGKLKDRLQVDEARAAELAGLAVRTYQRRKKEGAALSRSEADATLRTARVLEQAVATFGDEARAIEWLKAPSAFLDGVPLDLIASDAGAQAVLDELGRIHWGDLA